MEADSTSKLDRKGKRKRHERHRHHKKKKHHKRRRADSVESEAQRSESDSQQPQLGQTTVSAPETRLQSLSNHVFDREELMEQIFNVLSESEINRLKPKVVKDLPDDEFQELCVQHLKRISERRLLALIANESYESETEKAEEEEEKIDIKPKESGKNQRQFSVGGADDTIELMVDDGEDLDGESKSREMKEKVVAKEDVGVVASSEAGNRSLQELELREKELRAELEKTKSVQSVPPRKRKINRLGFRTVVVMDESEKPVEKTTNQPTKETQSKQIVVQRKVIPEGQNTEKSPTTEQRSTTGKGSVKPAKEKEVEQPEGKAMKVKVPQGELEAAKSDSDKDKKVSSSGGGNGNSKKDLLLQLERKQEELKALQQRALLSMTVLERQKKTKTVGRHFIRKQ